MEAWSYYMHFYDPVFLIESTLSGFTDTKTIRTPVSTNATYSKTVETTCITGACNIEPTLKHCC